MGGWWVCGVVGGGWWVVGGGWWVVGGGWWVVGGVGGGWWVVVLICIVCTGFENTDWIIGL